MRRQGGCPKSSQLHTDDRTIRTVLLGTALPSPPPLHTTYAAHRATGRVPTRRVACVCRCVCVALSTHHRGRRRSGCASRGRGRRRGACRATMRSCSGATITTIILCCSGATMQRSGMQRYNTAPTDDACCAPWAPGRCVLNMQSRRRCGRGEPSPGAGVGGVSPKS